MKKDLGSSLFLGFRNKLGPILPKLRKVESVTQITIPIQDKPGQLRNDGVLRYISEWLWFALEIRVFYQVDAHEKESDNTVPFNRERRRSQ